MPKAKQTSSKQTTKRKMRPALTPESREQQLISLAVDCAEQQLMDGTASSQVITHFLKLGSSRAELERAKLEHETKLLEAKTEAIQSQKNMEELYSQAITALKSYTSQDDSL